MPLPDDPITGFYTKEQLLEVWKSATDSSYNGPYIQAGDGGGLEAFNQGFAQLEMASKAIERSCEASYILPYSGQTGSPASGGQKATVMITVTRSNDISLPLVLDQFTTGVDEYARDYGKNGPIVVQTGRRYFFMTPVVFNPGERGPMYVEAQAELIGYGYNHPYPGTISAFNQPGVGFENEHGSVQLFGGLPTAVLVAANESDVPIPEHVGQTIEFVDGANLGTICRIISYEGPQLDAIPPNGGKVTLESLWVIEASVTGTLQEGEVVRQYSSDSIGVVLRVTDEDSTGLKRITISQSKGQFELGAGLVITGDTSGAVIDCDNVGNPEIAVIYATVFVAETGTASWRVRSWDTDWAVTVTNEERPSGGKAATLDQLGKERNITRVNGESDANYRKRIAQVSDIITPNAIKRRVNNITTPYGVEAQIREPPGFEAMPGFYLDVDAFDYDPTLNENDRFKWLFDFTEFRAMILIDLPALGYDDFGFALDEAPWDLDAFDGWPVGEASVYKRIYAAVDTARAGGVSLVMYRINNNPGFF